MDMDSLQSLLQICLDMDIALRNIYLRFLEKTENVELKSFWKDVINDETAHILFWKDAINLAKHHSFPIPDNLQQKKERLECMKNNFNRIFHDFHGYGNPNEELQLACILEFYFFDPIFIELFRTALLPAKKEFMEHYKIHVMKFIHAMRRYGNTSDVQIDITAEILENLYDLSLRLYDDSISDFLTGCLNKRGFFNSAIPLLALAEHEKKISAILMLDLDDFKKVNDTFGHAAGDKVLRVCADIMMKNVRASDLVGRYGGEEFIILLSHIHKTELENICERIRNRIEEIVNDKLGIPITVSIGAASSMIGPNELNTLVESADRLLYDAKQAGKNRYLIQACSVTDKTSG